MSTSPPSFVTMRPTFLSLVTLLGFVGSTLAQEVQPSNSTLSPPPSGTNLQLRLQNVNTDRLVTRFTVAPLTLPGGLNATTTQLGSFYIDGNLVLVNADNANGIGRGDIAYVSCEQDTSRPFSPNEIVAAAANQRPKAIVLYATDAVSCTLTGSFGYDAIYSITTAGDASYLRRLFGSFMPGSAVQAIIVAETSQYRGGTNNDGGPAPSTAVAMSILYSITGLITLLFIVIICSGALRAHRNPERYGPRRAIGGRPRQSRAKGLARAMLETLPIVKFGDPEPTKPGSVQDVELGAANNANTTAAGKTTDTKAASTLDKSGDKSDASTIPPAEAGTNVASGMGQAESQKSSSEHTGGDGELGCTICTEDFSAGEDVRVLPCRHKYHPACIDPWLLNVSGTCPLCRHDLNPTESTAEPEAATSELPPPLGQPLETRSSNETSSPARSRVARFLDLHRLRTATPDERIAALRELREQSRNEGSVVPEHEFPEPTRRTRLRDKLRFTRRAEEPAPTGSTSTAAEPSSTAAPATESTQNAPRP